MVSKMKPLLKLWLLKIKGTIRNLFKRKASGVFVIIMILFYGAMIVSLFNVDAGQIMAVNNIDLHMGILLLIGFQAIMLFATLMQSKKALFTGEDAFYLFTGPFTRRQVMSYLTFQTIIQAFLLALISLVFLAAFSGGAGFNFIFIVLAYLASVITVLFFLLLTDYLYVLSIGDKKYRKYSKIIPGIIIAFVVIIVLVLYLQTGNYHTLFMDFVQSNLFYVVPIFGWMKLALIAYVEHNYLLVTLGYLLLCGAVILVYVLFIGYRGNFYEQGEFRQGAYAVMSKNILLMRKTNSFISVSDLISIGIYIAVTIAVDVGFGMFIYMMVIWIFSSLQNSDLSKELKNYQIYLIPDKPFSKLIAVIIPTFIKIFVVAAVSFIAMGLYYHQSLMMIIVYLLNVIGYTSIFISGSVLSVRLLKSRTSPMMENFMRMIVMLIGAIPSAVITTAILLNSGTTVAMMAASYVALFVNFAISFLILYGCRNMMNGRELKSE